jgi:hypothetical protein
LVWHWVFSWVCWEEECQEMMVYLASMKVFAQYNRCQVWICAQPSLHMLYSDPNSIK